MDGDHEEDSNNVALEMGLGEEEEVHGEFVYGEGDSKQDEDTRDKPGLPSEREVINAEFPDDEGQRNDHRLQEMTRLRVEGHVQKGSKTGGETQPKGHRETPIGTNISKKI